MILDIIGHKFKHIRLIFIAFQCQIGRQTTVQIIFLFVKAILIESIMVYEDITS